MNTYNKIFLPIELNKALQNILSNVHHHYREHEKETDENIKEKQLREIYEPILSCQVLKDNIVWFNAWKRMHTGKPEVYFIKECDPISKRIINIYREKGNEYDQYVSSLSTLAKNYTISKNDNKARPPLDYAFLITTKKYQECDIEVANEYISDYFVYLNFEKLTELFKGINFSEHYSSISTAFKKSEEDGNERIIEMLKENYVRLSENTNNIDVIVSELTVQLSTSWQCSKKYGYDLNTLIEKEKILVSNCKLFKKEDHRENIIRLINYYFWVKLAFQEEWKVLLYLPGVIAKEFRDIPLGVNIGLKEMVPLEIILFLERAVLLFFTRDSVDFFEEKAKKERDLVKKLNRLLTDFQHIMLNNILGSINILIEEIVNGKSHLKEYIKNLNNFLHLRKNYLAKLAKYITDGDKLDSKISYNFKTILNQFLFINLVYFRGDIDEEISIENILTKWSETFVFLDNDINFQAYSGVMDTILENLIFNSVTVGFINNGKIYLKGGKHADINYFFYWDTGKGFEQSTFNNIDRWMSDGPTDREDRTGLGYWLISRSMDYNEGDLKIFALDKNKTLYGTFTPKFVTEYFIPAYLAYLSLENLKNGNLRVIHCFFETKLK